MLPSTFKNSICNPYTFKKSFHSYAFLQKHVKTHIKPFQQKRFYPGTIPLPFNEAKPLFARSKFGVKKSTPVTEDYEIIYQIRDQKRFTWVKVFLVINTCAAIYLMDFLYRTSDTPTKSIAVGIFITGVWLFVNFVFRRLIQEVGVFRSDRSIRLVVQSLIGPMEHRLKPQSIVIPHDQLQKMRDFTSTKSSYEEMYFKSAGKKTHFILKMESYFPIYFNVAGMLDLMQSSNNGDTKKTKFVATRNS